MVLRFSILGLMALLLVSGMASLSDAGSASEVSGERGLPVPDGPSRAV
ncbi:MAG: hypothetical protein ACOCTP_00790 [Roseicyclus sp.]